MMQVLQASLTVKDLEKSLAWYANALGFAISRRIERDGRPGAVAMESGAVKLMLHQDDGAKGWDREKGAGMSFYVVTDDDVDAMAQRIKDAGWTLELEPSDLPWGARAFRVRDPDGFRWAISRPLAA